MTGNHEVAAVCGSSDLMRLKFLEISFQHVPNTKIEYPKFAQSNVLCIVVASS